MIQSNTCMCNAAFIYTGTYIQKRRRRMAIETSLTVTARVRKGVSEQRRAIRIECKCDRLKKRGRNKENTALCTTATARHEREHRNINEPKRRAASAPCCGALRYASSEEVRSVGEREKERVDRYCTCSYTATDPQGSPWTDTLLKCYEIVISTQTEFSFIA